MRAGLPCGAGTLKGLLQNEAEARSWMTDNVNNGSNRDNIIKADNILFLFFLSSCERVTEMNKHYKIHTPKLQGRVFSAVVKAPQEYELGTPS